MREVASRLIVVLSASLTVSLLLLSCGLGGAHVGSGLAPTGRGEAARTAGAPRHTPTLAEALAQIDAYPAPKSVSTERWTTLTAELKRLVIARSAGGGSTRLTSGKTFSSSPTGAHNAVSNLQAYCGVAGPRATVMWTERLWGDYNNDGSVDIADLGPVALYYGEDITTGMNDAHMLVNAEDGNPVIGIHNLQPIADDYGMYLEGYEVWRGHFNGTLVDWETTLRPNWNAANPNWSEDRPSPPVSRRPSFRYQDDITSISDKANTRYKVVAHGGAAGAESNFASLTTAGLAFSPWPKFHANVKNTGYSFYGGAQTNTVKWTFLAGNYVFGSPSIATDGTIYFGSDDFKINALNPNGSLKWSFTTAGLVRGCPAVAADGTVYVGSNDGSVYALNPDGTRRWANLMGGGATKSSPTIGADGTLYMGCDDGFVYALNPANGTAKWTYSTGYATVSSPALDADGTVYIGSSNGKLYALDPLDGSVKWEHQTGGSIDSSPAIGDDGTIYVGSYDGNVYAFSPIDGSVDWTRATGGPVQSSPAIGPDGTIYIGSNDSWIYAINPANGTAKWMHSTSGSVAGSPAIGFDGTIYIGGTDAKVYALSPDGNEKWVYQTPYQVYSSPAIGKDGTVYVGCLDYKLYAFGP